MVDQRLHDLVAFSVERRVVERRVALTIQKHGVAAVVAERLDDVLVAGQGCLMYRGPTAVFILLDAVLPRVICSNHRRGRACMPGTRAVVHGGVTTEVCRRRRKSGRWLLHQDLNSFRVALPSGHVQGRLSKRILGGSVSMPAEERIDHAGVPRAGRNVQREVRVDVLPVHRGSILKADVDDLAVAQSSADMKRVRCVPLGNATGKPRPLTR